MATETNLWPTVEHALWYLERADGVPHRTEGEATLLEFLPERVDRVLDLGTGDGRLLALVRTARPGAAGLGLDRTRGNGARRPRAIASGMSGVANRRQ